MIERAVAEAVTKQKALNSSEIYYQSVTVTSDAKSTTSTASVQHEEEMVIDSGDQFIVEDEHLAWGKDMAQIVAVAQTRRMVSVIAVDSSEDEKEAKKSEPKRQMFQR